MYKLISDKEIRIAISGKSGCGNTTVSSLLAEKLGILLVNYTFRQLAAEKKLTLEQVIENASKDDFYDKYVDIHQVELAQKESCVLGSRLAIWMLKNADLKVYLVADDETRTKRILNREGGDFEKIKAFTAMRDSEDRKRYLKLYSIDNNDYSFADLIIDSTQYTPEEIVDLILKELINKNLIEKSV